MRILVAWKLEFNAASQNIMGRKYFLGQWAKRYSLANMKITFHQAKAELEIRNSGFWIQSNEKKNIIQALKSGNLIIVIFKGTL